VTDGGKTERYMKRHHTFKAITTSMEGEIKIGEKEAHGLPSPIN
jgi:hypothetical protein